MVEQAATQAIAQLVIPFPPYDLYIIGTGIAILLAVAVVGVLILKRKS